MSPPPLTTLLAASARHAPCERGEGGGEEEGGLRIRTRAGDLNSVSNPLPPPRSAGRAKNIGFTTTRLPYGTLSELATVRTMAHEMGHNLGSSLLQSIPTPQIPIPPPHLFPLLCHCRVGARHTCCRTSAEACAPGTFCGDLLDTECVAPYAWDQYLMYPSITFSTNGEYMSPCSILSIMEVVQVCFPGLYPHMCRVCCSCMFQRWMSTQ